MTEENDSSAGAGLQRALVEAIRAFVAASPANRLRLIDGTPIFEEPLVGFADGDDPLFGQYKTAVGRFHLTPREALAQYAGAATAPAHVSVVAWVLPIARRTRQSNAKMSDGPSQRWNHTRFHGEELNDDLRRYVQNWLGERGYRAAAPALPDNLRTFDLPNGPASTWSERHIAYAAGLGTFGLSDGLITERGMAHRCGSVVTDAPLVATERPYAHHHAYCLYFHDGSCGKCIKRCPAGAISERGHDKLKCREFLMVTRRDWVKRPGYIGAYPGCGLCQTDVPCAARIPRRIAKTSRE